MKTVPVIILIAVIDACNSCDNHRPPCVCNAPPPPPRELYRCRNTPPLPPPPPPTMSPWNSVNISQRVQLLQHFHMYYSTSTCITHHMTCTTHHMYYTRVMLHKESDSSNMFTALKMGNRYLNNEGIVTRAGEGWWWSEVGWVTRV